MPQGPPEAAVRSGPQEAVVPQGPPEAAVRSGPLEAALPGSTPARQVPPNPTAVPVWARPEPPVPPWSSPAARDRRWRRGAAERS